MPFDVLDRLLRPLRSGRATSRYPDSPPALPAAARGLPELDLARCDRSAACADACPTRAITLGEGTWALDAGACILCGACARACPRDAIRMSHRIELDGRTRASLVVRHPVGGVR